MQRSILSGEAVRLIVQALPPETDPTPVRIETPGGLSWTIRRRSRMHLGPDGERTCYTSGGLIIDARIDESFPVGIGQQRFEATLPSGWTVPQLERAIHKLFFQARSAKRTLAYRAELMTLLEGGAFSPAQIDRLEALAGKAGLPVLYEAMTVEDVQAIRALAEKVQHEGRTNEKNIVVQCG